MSLAVEGAAHSGFNSGASGSVAVTTNGADRIIILVLGNEAALSQTFNAPTASGLTFQKRSGQTWVSQPGTFMADQEVWWAYASAQLTAESIAVTTTGIIDNCSIGVFAVSGVDPSRFGNPWDTNGSLPAYASNPTNTNNVPVVSGISTDESNCLLLFLGNSTNGTGINGSGAQSGFTRIDSFTESAGTWWSSQANDSGNVSSKQSGATLTSTVAGLAYWGALADALTSDPEIASSESPSDEAASSDHLLVEENSSDHLAGEPASSEAASSDHAEHEAESSLGEIASSEFQSCLLYTSDA